MKIQNTLMMATFSLLSVLISHTGYAQAVPTPTAKSTSVQISSFPFTITAPGTYVLTGNLSFSNLPAALIINGDIIGKVVLDLGGFSVNGSYHNNAIKLLNDTNTLSTNRSLIIRNGNLQFFAVAIQAGDSTLPGYLNKIQIQNITFRGSVDGDINFNKVNNSVISDCSFVGATPR